MNTALKITKYQLQDAIRGRWVILYTLFFVIATELMIQFGATDSRVIVSLMNLVLVLIPLISIVFGTMYVHHSRNFIELLLSQPVSRKSLFGGIYAGLALPLSLGFLVGVGGPLLLHISVAGRPGTVVSLLGAGLLLTLVFTALALVVALRSENRVQAVGLALLLWVFFTVVYDGLILLASYSLSAYPLEHAMIVAAMLNPVDLGRILLLLQIDIAALMGYTGAVFEQFFGSPLGLTLSAGALVAWMAVSLFLALRTFLQKDF
jgi:Cu-processing system permease protein